MANINEREKKTPEEIKQKILIELDKQQGPLSVQEISKNINSNWTTVKEYLEELIREGKIKEIIATDKLKFYQKITGDTYYNIPITEEQRNEFRYLFSAIIEEYKKKRNRLPKRTELAKTSVDIINEVKLNLPVVWYIYGQIPLMISDPLKNYSVNFVPKDHEIIKKAVVNFVKENKISVRDLEKDHYTKYGNKLYMLKEELLKELDKKKNDEKVLNLFSEFYIECPVYDRAETFKLTEKLYSLISKLSCIKSLDKYKPKEIIALDSLWKFISMCTLIDSILKYPQYKKEIVMLYLGPVLETKKYLAEEAIKSLEESYFEELPKELEISLSKEASEAREIMSEWSQSEVWRE